VKLAPPPPPPPPEQQAKMAVRGYFRFPALDAHGHLAFTSDSDLFLAHLPPSLDEIAADAEMAAVRLTRGQGCAAFASFSADGERLAFASSHEGGAVDLYVMPTKGGRIARLTFEGNVDDELVGARNGTVVCGWQGDQVLYASPHFTTLPDAQLSLCSATTGDVERIPLAQASDGCFATLNNQRMLFFTRLPPQSSHTRRYHGGSAQTLWRVDLNADGSPAAEAVALTPDTEFQGTSKRPQWSAALQRLFFLSDRGETETMNLWSMGADGSDKCQHTYARSSEYELRHVSLVDIAPDTSRAVYQQGADLFAIGLTDRTSQPAPVLLPIVLNTGFELQEEQLVGNPLQYLTAAALSPSGDKVSMSIRGQVFVLPTDADSNGRIVDATAKLPAAQRWKQLEFLSETTVVAIGNASGEDELYLLPTSGMTAEGGSDAGAGVVQLTSDGFCMRSSLCISPNGSHIALLDSERNLWVIDVAEAKASDEPGAGTVLVHHADNYGTTHAELSWSPDGCWLAFVTAAPNTFDTLQVWECGRNAAPIPITSDRSANHSPAWSPDGCWLYFLSDRELKNVVGSPWGDRVPEPQFDKSTRVYALALQEGLRPPWLLLNELTDQEDEEDEEDEDDAEEDTDGAEDDETDEDGNAAAGDDGGAKKKRQSKKGGKTHAVVMAGGPAATATRLYELPIASGNYTSVVALPNDKLLLRTGGTLSRVVLEPKQSLKRRNVASGVSRMVLSADSSSLLLGFGASGFYVFTTSAVSFKPSSDTKVVTSGLRVTVDPVEERSAMYTDAWRMLRDQFYDPNMHGKARFLRARTLLLLLLLLLLHGKPTSCAACHSALRRHPR
jgi:tricorn protease